MHNIYRNMPYSASCAVGCYLLRGGSGMVLEYQGLELGMRRLELFDNVQFL